MNSKEIAGNIKFDRLKLQFKSSELEFEEMNFKTIYQIDNLKTFWEIYQNVEFPEIIQKGSIFLSLKTPIWNPDFGTFSFIVSKGSNKNINEIFTDISLFFIENQLNGHKKIEGVSITLKGRERNIFNIKVILNNQNPNEINFDSLPEYFGKFKFSLNCERSNGFETIKRSKYNNNKYHHHRQQQQQQLPPHPQYANKNYYNNNNKKKSKKIQQQQQQSMNLN